MEVTRTPFKAPLLVLDGFLANEDAAACLDEAIALRPVYMPSSVGQGKSNRRDPNYRTNEVVMLDSVFSAARERSRILTLVKKRIEDSDCNALWHEGYTIFDAINYANWRESVLSRYADGHYYREHQDTKFNAENTNEITQRLVTLIYYMNREPEGFEGGNLIVREGNDRISIQPKHNRAVVFPSFCFHQVEPVSMKTPDFAGGRFSLNHWMGFR